MSTRASLDLQKAASADIYGKRCGACECDLDWVHFAKDSSSRDGHAALCWDCQAAPRLSTSEHISRLSELNYNAEATKKQRWANQEELYDSDARVGRAMNHTDFLPIVQKLVPSLYVTPGGMVGDLAIYQTAPGPQNKWGGNSFKYLFFCPMGRLPEFSQYQFDARDIPVRESRRGWRTVLLRLIKSGLLDEQICNQVFGRAEGQAAARYNRELFNWRNSKNQL